MKTIAELAEEKFVAAERYRLLGMSNIAGLDYEERKKSAIRYAEAEAEMFRTAAALDAAIRAPSRIQPAAAAEGPSSPEGVK